MAEQDNFIGQGAALNGQASMRPYKEPGINPFDAAIPGQSLTDNPGNGAWEHPPQFSDIEDATDYVYGRLQKKENLKRIVVLLKMGIPIEALVKIITFSGFLEGKWTVDGAKLLDPAVAMMITSIAELGKIPAKAGLGNVNDEDFFDEMAHNNMAIEQDRSGSPMIPAAKIPPQIENKGLMARGNYGA